MYLLFSSKSCDNGEQREAIRDLTTLKTIRDSICSTFSSERPSGYALVGFEESAKMKSSDLMDYLRIVSDTATVPTFRKQAKKLLKNMFACNNCIITFNYGDKAKKETVAISDFVDLQSDINKYFGNLEADSIWLIDRLQPEGDSVFTGKLGYRLKAISTASYYRYNTYVNGTIEFSTAKRSKKFGKQALSVWTVLYRNIEISPTGI